MQYLREDLSRIDESWAAARFDSLPHVVHILTSKDREAAAQFLKEQSDVVEEVVDEVVHSYHSGFNRAIQNYSQVFKVSFSMNILRNILVPWTIGSFPTECSECLIIYSCIDLPSHYSFFPFYLLCCQEWIVAFWYQFFKNLSASLIHKFYCYMTEKNKVLSHIIVILGFISSICAYAFFYLILLLMLMYYSL